MAAKITKFIRWALTLLLIWGVYTETGIFTSITIGLSLISIEIIVAYLKCIREILKETQ